MHAAVKGMILGMACVLFMSTTTLADVSPGQVINKTNVDKIEGMVPDFIIDWVKKGDLTMKIGQIKFDPKTFHPKEVMDNWQANKGKYKIDENNGVIEVATGKHARGIKGLPFPEPDQNSPTLPMELLWNKEWQIYYMPGDAHSMEQWLSVTRSGVDKTMTVEKWTKVLDPSKNQQYDFAEMDVFRAPFSMAGIGTLCLFPIYPTDNGERFIYAPELGKVRRMSHRLAGSDPLFGLDNVADDAWVGVAKTAKEQGTYRFIGMRDALMPYLSETPIKVKKNAKGEIGIGALENGVEAKMNCETPGSEGAAWHIANVVWVKTKCYVFESRSTDKNYNFGPIESWVDADSLNAVFKRMTDPNGELWKGMYWASMPMETEDGSFRANFDAAQVLVDNRRDHGTFLPGAHRKGLTQTIFMNHNDVLFTRGSFVKFTK